MAIKVIIMSIFPVKSEVLHIYDVMFGVEVSFAKLANKYSAPCIRFEKSEMDKSCGCKMGH